MCNLYYDLHSPFYLLVTELLNTDILTTHKLQHSSLMRPVVMILFPEILTLH